VDTLYEIRSFLLVLLPIAAGARAVFCFIAQATAEDPSQYKKRLINLLIFLVFAETIVAFLPMILGYFGG